MQYSLQSSSNWLEIFMQKYGLTEDKIFNIDGVGFILKTYGVDKIKIFCHYGFVNELQGAKAYKMLLHMNFLLSSDFDGNRPIFSVDEDDMIIMEDILLINEIKHKELYEFLYQLAAHAKKWQYNFGIYRENSYILQHVQ